MEITLDLCGPQRCARLRCPAAGLDTWAMASDGRAYSVWAGDYALLGLRGVRPGNGEALQHLGSWVAEFRGPTASLYLHTARPARRGATPTATHCLALAAEDCRRLEYVLRAATAMTLRVRSRGWVWRLLFGRTGPIDATARPWRGDVRKALLPPGEDAAPRPAVTPAKAAPARRVADEDRDTGRFAYTSSFPSAAGQGSPAAFREWREWAGAGGAAGGAGASGAWLPEGEARSVDMPGGVPGFPAAVRQEIRNEGGALTVGLLDAAGRQVGGWRMPEGLAGPLVLEDGSRLTVTESGVEMRSEGGVALAWREGDGEAWQSLPTDSLGGAGDAWAGTGGGTAGPGAAGDGITGGQEGGSDDLAADRGDDTDGNDGGGTTY